MQFKNIELIKNESLVKMYKKKLDDLQDIKQTKRAIELERDNLRGEIEQLKARTTNNKDSKKVLEYYKVELENSKRKAIEFEDAVKDKNNEIVNLKNVISKLEREARFKDEKISSLETQMEELLCKSDDSYEDLKHKVAKLENELELRKVNTEDSMTTEKLIILEESNKDREAECVKNRQRIEELQKIIRDLEEEIDNLKNELSTINEHIGDNAEVQRTSIEGIKRNQIERDFRKLNQEKIKLETDLQKAKDQIRDLEKCK